MAVIPPVLGYWSLELLEHSAIVWQWLNIPKYFLCCLCDMRGPRVGILICFVNLLKLVAQLCPPFSLLSTFHIFCVWARQLLLLGGPELYLHDNFVILLRGQESLLYFYAHISIVSGYLSFEMPLMAIVRPDDGVSPLPLYHLNNEFLVDFVSLVLLWSKSPSNFFSLFCTNLVKTLKIHDHSLLLFLHTLCLWGSRILEKFNWQVHKTWVMYSVSSLQIIVIHLWIPTGIYV